MSKNINHKELTTLRRQSKGSMFAGAGDNIPVYENHNIRTIPAHAGQVSITGNNNQCLHFS
jgi:hypothetical protein